MAILMLITNLQETPVNNIDDVLGVFEDDHPFSDHELSRFGFLTVTGSRANEQARLNQARPMITIAYYYDGEYAFNTPDLLGAIEVWSTLSPPVRWYELNDDDKYIFKVGDLTQEERDFISTPEFDVNSPLVDNYIEIFVKNLGRKPANTTEVRDLRGTQP